MFGGKEALRNSLEQEIKPLEVPRLKELNPNGRTNLVRIASSGIESKFPRNSKTEIVTEEEIIREFQQWQQNASEFLQTKEGADFILSRGPYRLQEFPLDIDGLIFLGDRELRLAAERLASHSMKLMQGGTSVTYALLNPGGASNEYVLLHVLESLEKQGVDQKMLQVLHHRWMPQSEKHSVAQQFHQFEEFALQSGASKHVIATLDDWRISGIQIQSELSETGKISRMFRSHYPEHQIFRNLQLLFEASNREDKEQDFSTLETPELSVTPAYSGEWLGPHRQGISGVWTLVDFGFHGRKDFVELSRVMQNPLPMAFKILRPTEVIPQKGKSDPILYKNDVLRNRSMQTFYKWCGGSSEIPDSTMNAWRVFEQSKKASDWEGLKIMRDVDISAFFSGVRENPAILRELAQALSKKIRIARTISQISLLEEQEKFFQFETEILVDELLQEKVAELGHSGERIHEFELIMLRDQLLREVLHLRSLPVPAAAEAKKYRLLKGGEFEFFQFYQRMQGRN